MKKKTFKRAGVAVLSMAMLLSMGAVAATSVSAATGDALKVNVSANSSVGTTVEIYQVAKRGGTGTWEYNEPFASISGITALSSLTSSTSATDLNALANELKSYVNTTNVGDDTTAKDTLNKTKVGTGTVGSDITITDVTGGVSVTGVGYYLVLVADGTAKVQPTLVQIDSNGEDKTTLDPKTNPISITKKITATTDGDVSATGNTSVGVAGSTVNYQLDSQIPTYDDNVAAADIKPYVITDDPSSGIDIKNGENTFSASASKIVVTVSTDNSLTTTDDNITLYKDGEAQGSYGVRVSSYNDGFKVTIPGADIKNSKEETKLQGKYVFVTFEAKVNEAGIGKAVLGDSKVTDADSAHAGKTGNPNTAYVSYGNNYSTGGYADSDGKPIDENSEPENPGEDDDTTRKPSNTVTTYIGEIDVLKTDTSTNPVALGKAEFDLYSVTYKTHATGGNTYPVYTVTKDDGTGVEAYYVSDYGRYYATSDDTEVEPKAGTTPVKTEQAETKLNATSYVTSDADDTKGIFEFGYLAEGTYRLKETKAPSGYVAVGDYTFTVAADTDRNGEYDNYTVTSVTAPTQVSLTGSSGDYRITVKDPDANALPGTGGIGTTLFTVGGAAVVLVAGFMFILYMRKKNDAEE